MILQNSRMDFQIIQIFQFQAAQMHFSQAHVTIRRPIAQCKRTDYSPKAGRVIETRAEMKISC